MTVTIGRRELLAALGGAAVVWPLAARAQRAGKLPTIGFFGPNTASAWRPWTAAFVQRLRELGWIEGRNLAIEYRWADARSERFAEIAAEFVRLKVDVIVTGGNAAVAAKQVSSVVPIVFALLDDPVSMGLIASLARPGGNATGFMVFEYGIGGKWLELLKEIAPGVTRVAALRDPATPSGAALFGVIQAMAPSLRVEVNHVNVREATDVGRAVTALAQSANGGLIVLPAPSTVIHRDLIIELAAQYRLPAVYFESAFVAAGGLVSYGPDQTDQFRQAAGYVDRILRGEKPADLPVQMPTKYELVINLKTAKALGLAIPDKLLALADQVIE